MASVCSPADESRLVSSSYMAGIGLVFLAGICWSLGGILFRLISHADVWQTLFYRSIFMMNAMVPVIIFMNKGRFVDAFKKAGLNGAIAGFCIALASISYVLSLTYTTVANASFMIGAVPFFSAALGWWLLRESVSAKTVTAIAVAASGMGLMVFDSVGAGQFIGNALALYSSLAFACFIVLLRWNGKTEMAPALFWSGLFVSLIAALILVVPNPFRPSEGLSSLAPPVQDFFLFAVMGFVQLGLGLFLYTRGAKTVPAAELGLLSLVEPVLGAFWVWLFISETPTLMTIVGGALIMSAIAGQAASGVVRKRLPRTSM
ncbi:MAG: DMT family transporter [Hyphomicrobiales bacterium]